MLSFYKFESLYGVEDLSDVTIVLSAPSEDAAPLEPPAKRTRLAAKQHKPSKAAVALQCQEELLPGHGAVLAGCSPVFMAQLTRWRSEASPSGKAKPRITLQLSTQSELEAARALVRFIYTQRLPDSAPQQQLMLMLQLADRYDVQPCAAACGDALGALQLEPDTMRQLLQLPHACSSSPQLARLFSKVADQLQQEFGDLEEAWADNEKHERLLGLPLQALELLLRDERTKVANENTVVWVLSVWLMEPRQGLTADDKKRLGSLVRLPFLTPFFAASVALVLPWLNEAVGQATVAAAMAIAQTLHSSYAGLIPTDGSFDWPHSWKLGRRPLSARTKLQQDWRLSLADMQAVFEGNAKADGLGDCNDVMRSPECLFGGYVWYMSFERQPPPECQQDGSHTLGLYIVPYLGTSMAYGSAAPVLIRGGCVSCTRADGGEPRREWLGDHVLADAAGGRSWGWADFWEVGPMSGWEPGRFAPWTDDSGHVNLTLTISEVM